MASKKNKPKIKWLKEPEDHDYPAALSYLQLSFDDAASKKIVEELKKTAVTTFKAKDIFRASSLSLLGISNLHVKKDRDKIKSGTAISPLLLVRSTSLAKVIIADGYHRLCAVYSFDEDALIPCKIV
ncbi:MAG: hypothetical protein EKK37_02175 [Sphingobacteriales bacterium]|nr:MAG: hypothetical protein EKK37_02175 [Sphingobacteriales bacterium]